MLQDLCSNTPLILMVLFLVVLVILKLLYSRKEKKEKASRATCPTIHWTARSGGYCTKCGAQKVEYPKCSCGSHYNPERHDEKYCARCGKRLPGY